MKFIYIFNIKYEYIFWAKGHPEIGDTDMRRNITLMTLTLGNINNSVVFYKTKKILKVLESMKTIQKIYLFSFTWKPIICKKKVYPKF